MTISIIAGQAAQSCTKYIIPHLSPWPGKLPLYCCSGRPSPAARSCPLCVPFPHKLDVTRLQLGPVRYQLLAVKAFCKLLCCLTKLSFCAFMNSHRPARPLPNHEIQLNSGCQ